MNAKPIIVWFRNDLRLNDHPALFAAVRSGAPIIPLYILDNLSPGVWAMGGASRWWVAKSLEMLAADLSTRGGKLVLRRGDTARVLPRIAEETAAAGIFFTRSYEPWGVALEAELKLRLDASCVEFRRFGGRLLREPEDVCAPDGRPYKVYTAFWRAFSERFAPAKHLPAPAQIRSPAKQPKSDDLESWKLVPAKPDWSCGIAEAWQPGEASARSRLKKFMSTNFRSYAADRDRMDKPGTSRLSPHLAFGEISPAECWRQACAAASGVADRATSLEKFLKELVWREFSYSLLFHWPQLPTAPFRDAFSAFEWLNDAEHARRWKRGQTGYPIVDAGMRELWQTGYMHNRVRMITASFLVKHLLIPWQTGEAWFWDTLVDADLANNSASWQWVAGSGADAAPYFRIFNPVLQSKKFDPSGSYLRRWIPELARLPNSAIHAPWTADAETLVGAGVELGGSYPLPIVRHREARERALAVYQRLKKSAHQ